MNHWEEKLLQAVSSETGWQLVEAFSKQMRCLPQDVTRGAEIIEQMLRKSGLDPVVHYPEIYLGIPLSASVSTNGKTIAAKASALSPGVSGLTAPLLHLKAKPSQQGVHPGDAASLFERRFANTEDAIAEVAGKIVLTEGLSNPARTQLLQSWGALAVIVINPGDRSHWGTNSVIWGSPVGDEIHHLPKIASVAVSRAEGDVLRDLAAAGQSVSLDVEALHGWFRQPVVTAEVKGFGPEAEDFVLLHSHYDSWDYGVGDNATGNAVVLEVARLFNQFETPMRRTVRFAWWPGHSAGRYAGSAWYADAFGSELSANCVAHVNCDSPGCADATSYHVIRSMREAGPLLRRSVAELFGQQCEITRPGRAGDYSFNNLGIPGTMLTSSMVPREERDRRGWYPVGGCGGSPAWHSEYDTIEVASRDVLENDIRLYAIVVARLANEPGLPLDYAETLMELREVIGKLAPARFTPAQVAKLDSDLENAADRLSEALERHGRSSHSANRLLKKVSRILVRLNFALGPAHVQDPARSLQPVPVLANAPGLDDMSPQATIARMRAWNALTIATDQLRGAIDG
ncbi:MAG: M28 family peptidase [Pseudomonadota bacterium]